MNVSSTCVDLNQQLSCVALAQMGCNCYGCCWEALPPPASPPPPSPPPTSPPPAAMPALTPAAGGGVDVCGELAAGTTVVLEASVAYSLTCTLNVTAGATLVIEAGTTVSVASGAAALVVERGGQLLAEGSVKAPITFDGSVAVGGGVGWGGLVLHGEASHGVSPGHDDSSGVLRYVRIWHARTGLALWGVGNGTLIDHCEVAFSRGDSFDFRGGTADVRALSSLFAAGAAFHTAAGYRGRGQFLFAALGANGTAGVAVEAAPSASPAEQTQPLFYSLTVLGGGAAGLADSALVRLGDGVGGALANAVLVHSAGAAVQLPPAASAALPSQHRPPPPPSPPRPSLFEAMLLRGGAECGRQHADGYSDGVSLGFHSSAGACALAAGAHFEVHGNCSTFQWSPAYPAVWDCICCVQADGGRLNRLWSVYALAAAPPPLPSLPPLPGTPPAPGTPPLPPLPPSSPAIAFGGALYLASSNLVHAVGSSSAGSALLPAALAAREADPGLVSVDAGCLSSECLLSSSAHFDPRPTADGAACASEPEDATALDGGRFFSQTACSGAFASAHYEGNWLGGWSLLFPSQLGASVASPIQLPLLTATAAASTLLHFTPTNASAATPAASARRRLHPSRRLLNAAPACDASTPIPHEALRLQCVSSSYSGIGAAMWVRIRPHASEVQLSTCTRGGGGFDTDLAVFRLTGQGGGTGCALEPVGCNGDGFGEEGCQPLYSRLSFGASEGATYLVAVSGYDGVVGANVTLSVEALRPPAPPLAPPPLAPPPPPLGSAWLQGLIDRSSAEVPLVLSLDADVHLVETIVIRAPRTVVLRGAGVHNQTVLSGQLRFPPAGAEAHVRAFDVHDGARLYLANLVIYDARAAPGACGGAVLVRGAGVLVAQHVAFVHNEASRGGAICVESHGALTLVAVRMESNEAAIEGHDLYLGRPTTARAPLVELRGVTLSGHAAADIARHGAWATLSCPPAAPEDGREGAAQAAAEAASAVAGTVSAAASAAAHHTPATTAACLFHRQASASASTLWFGGATNAQCAASVGADGLAYGVACECREGVGGRAGAVPSSEQIELAAYGPTPLQQLLREVGAECIQAFGAAPVAFASDSMALTVVKGSATHATQTLAISVLLIGDGRRVPPAPWYHWRLQPSTPLAGEYAMSACQPASNGSETVDIELASCSIGADGTMRVVDGDIEGEPLRILQGAGTINPSESARLRVSIPVRINASGVRETERLPYVQTLHISTSLDASYATNLTVLVSVSAPTHAPSCTYVPPTAPTAPSALPPSMAPSTQATPSGRRLASSRRLSEAASAFDQFGEAHSFVPVHNQTVDVFEEDRITTLAVLGRLTVRTGRYDPARPEKAGAKFEFVMRDVDGLPVVSETFEHRRRVETFRAELVRASHASKPAPLPIEFVGNKARGQDGVYRPLPSGQRAPRAMDGRVEVWRPCSSSSLTHDPPPHPDFPSAPSAADLRLPCPSSPLDSPRLPLPRPPLLRCTCSSSTLASITCSCAAPRATRASGLCRGRSR